MTSLDARPRTRPASAFVISITPFEENGDLDEAAVRGHLRRMAGAGIGVYVGGGGSGEGYTLSAAETRRLAEIAAEELKGKVPVRAMGVEPRTAGQMIDFMNEVEAAGVDAAQLYSLELGHAHLPTPEEVERYLTDVLENTTIPCVISTHQSVGYRISVPLLRRLVSTYDRIIGINCSHGDIGYVREIYDAVGADVDLHVGGEGQGLQALSLGGTGFLSSIANLTPHLAMAVVDSYNAGDLARTFDAFDRLTRLSAAVYSRGGILAQKAMLNRLGLPGGYPRLPHLPASGQATETLAALVEELGVASYEGWPEG